MRLNIPSSFWEQAHAEFVKINIDHRTEIVEHNRRLGLTDDKSFMKHASYVGAIQVPPDFPDNLIAFTDTRTNRRFCDPGNKVYRDFFVSCWPNVTCVSNAGSVGDLVEAILGLAWTKSDRGKRISPEAEDFVKMLEQACLSDYLLGLYYTASE